MRTLRRHRTMVMIAALVVVVVACIGLFIRNYQGTGNDSAGSNVQPSSTPSTFIPSLSTSSKKSAAPTGSAIPKGGVTNFTFPNGLHYTGGNNDGFRFGPQHIVVLRVWSQNNRQLIRIGWLAPESYDAPYGDIKHVASPWSLTLHSSGDKYHAALFIGTDATGWPVTCQITVDGVVKQTLTANHDFGRQTCVG